LGSAAVCVGGREHELLVVVPNCGLMRGMVIQVRVWAPVFCSQAIVPGPGRPPQKKNKTKNHITQRTTKTKIFKQNNVAMRRRLQRCWWFGR